MKKVYFLFILVLSLAVLGNAQESNNSRLQTVKKIYVTELGTTDSSSIIREKIRIRLMQTGKFTVVERAADADAVLTGTAVMEKHVDGDLHDIDTEEKGVAVFYLRSAEADEVIWTYEYKPKFFNLAILTDKATRGYNQLANRTVEKLLKDAGYKTK
jgi:hypothetical protein